MKKYTRKSETSRPTLSSISEPVYNLLNNHSKVRVSRVSKNLRRNFAPAPKNKIKFEAMTSIKQLFNSKNHRLTKNRAEKILSQMQTHNAKTVVNAFTQIQDTPWNIKDVYTDDTTLTRKFRNIGDENMNLFSIVLASGGLPSLSYLFLQNNRITDDGLISLANAITPDKNGKGSLPQLKMLRLDSNAICDAGMTAFAKSCAMGALTNLTILDLTSNKIGNPGMSALAGACAKWALPKCSSIFLMGNPGNDEPVKKALRERK